MANMYYFAIGLLIHWSGEGAAIPLGGVAMNLVVVTLGNWVGGALLVGGVYWVIYRRKRD